MKLKTKKKILPPIEIIEELKSKRRQQKLTTIITPKDIKETPPQCTHIHQNKFITVYLTNLYFQNYSFGHFKKQTSIDVFKTKTN